MCLTCGLLILTDLKKKTPNKLEKCICGVVGGGKLGKHRGCWFKEQGTPPRLWLPVEKGLSGHLSFLLLQNENTPADTCSLITLKQCLALNKYTFSRTCLDPREWKFTTEVTVWGQSLHRVLLAALPHSRSEPGDKCWRQQAP